MLNLALGVFLLLLLVWSAKKAYFFVQGAQEPEKFPGIAIKSSKREIEILRTHIERWHQEGKLSRQEYEHLTNLVSDEIP